MSRFSAVVLSLLVACGAVRANESGAALYAAKCAHCHGTKGEGVKDQYAQPLIGDRSLRELTSYIQRTMPDDDPGSLKAEEAKQLGEHVFHAYYSAAAQDRNYPARVELSRLTVRQYQNVVADIIGSFREQAKWDDQRGLKGEYYKGRRIGGEKPIDRIDPTLDFDFGTAGPSDQFEAHQFSIRWEGGLLAPETGEYEIVLKTDHSARLWLNDPKTPLIDVFVKSGKDTEFRERVKLLGGRVYPVKLEFSKAKQGVDDSKNQKTPPPLVPAFVKLAWKPPHQPEQIIPSRFLNPNRAPMTYVLTTPFPPDDRSTGYERGTTISKAWDEATTAAAIETATYVTTRLPELAGVKDDAGDRKERLKSFCVRWAELALRRPLSPEQLALYVDRQFEDVDPTAAVKRVILLTLKSPRFLYREVDGETTPHHTAARLSFALWDSIPDKELFNAANSGKLKTREDLARQAERMLPSLRTRAKLREFFLQWLRVEHYPDIAKDKERFPDFDAQVAADLRTSLELTLDDIVWGDNPDFRRLLQSDAVFLNGRLAKVYGAELPADAPFQKVSLDTGKRSGLITHPYLLAGFAYSTESSPIHRGVFVSRSILGRSLRAPPEAAAPLAADLHPDLTTRERTALQTKSRGCMSCHGLINPLGFPLEHFDAVGRYRSEEHAKPIDAAGGYLTRGGSEVAFTGAPEFAAFLAGSEETHTAFVRQLFHYLVKQPIRALGGKTLPNLRQSFTERDFNVRKLVTEIAVTAALNQPSN